MLDFITQAALIEAGIVLAIALVAGIVLQRILESFRQLDKKHLWLKSLGDSLYHSVFWVVMIYGLLFAVEAFVRDDTCFIPFGAYLKGRKLFTVFVISWFLFKWKACVSVALAERVKKGKNRANSLALITVGDKVATIAVFVLAGFAVLDIFNVPIQALLAFGGIGSLAVSWAAKDMIANFFGGMMIFVNHPFYVGDWVKSPNKNFEGVVEEIGWYMTRIRTFERRPTYIPNALITDAIVENPGRMYNRRIKTTIGLRYEDIDKVDRVVAMIDKMLRNHEDIDQNQLLFVHFLEYGAYSLDISIYAFTKTTNWGQYRSVQQDVLLKVYEIIKENDADIAFPTQTLHIHREQES